MPCSVQVQTHLFENRLFIYPSDSSLLAEIQKNEGDVKGAGIRVYSEPWGWLLEKIGFATKFKINDDEFFVNTNSLCQYFIRNKENSEKTFFRLHQLYMEHKKERGYDETLMKSIRSELSTQSSVPSYESLMTKFTSGAPFSQEVGQPIQEHRTEALLAGQERGTEPSGLAKNAGQSPLPLENPPSGKSVGQEPSKEIAPVKMPITRDEKIKFVLEALQENEEDKIQEVVGSDRELAIAIVQQDSRALRCFSDEFRDDEEIALAAIAQDASAIYAASFRLKRSPDFIKRAIRHNIDVYERVERLVERLENDPQILAVVAEVQKTLKSPEGSKERMVKSVQDALATGEGILGNAFRRALDDKNNNWNDKESVLAAVSLKGALLSFACRRLRYDKDVVLAAVKNDPDAFRYAEVGLKRDDEFVKLVEATTKKLPEAKKPSEEVTLVSAVNKETSAQKPSQTFEQKVQDVSGFYRLSNNRSQKDLTLFDDEKVMTAVIEKGYTVLRDASDRLKDSEKFVLLAIKKNILEMEYASDRLKNDQAFLLKAIGLDPLGFSYVSKKLRNDPGFIIKAVAQNGKVLKYLWGPGKEVVIAALQQIFSAEGYVDDAHWASVPENLRDAPEVKRAAGKPLEPSKEVTPSVQRPPEAKEVTLASDSKLTEAKKVSKETSAQKPSQNFEQKVEDVIDVIYSNKSSQIDLTTLNDALNDEKVMTAVIERGYNILRHASDRLKGNEELVLLAIKKSFSQMVHASDRLKNDQAFLLKAIELNAYCFTYVSEKLKDDPGFILKAVAQNGEVLLCLPEHKKTREVVIAALQQICRAKGSAYGWTDYVPENLRDDPEVKRAAEKLLEPSKEATPSVQRPPEAKGPSEVVTLVSDSKLTEAKAASKETSAQKPSQTFEQKVQDVIDVIYLNKNRSQIDVTIFDDEKVMAAVIEKGYNVLGLATDRLKGNEELVLLAIKKNVPQMRYASDRLKNDQAFLLKAIELNAYCFVGVSEELRNDQDFILKAVAQNGKVLKYLYESDKTKVVVIAALQQICRAEGYVDALHWDYVPKSLQDDVDVKKAAGRK